jgi:hypothetical protein
MMVRANFAYSAALRAPALSFRPNPNYSARLQARRVPQRAALLADDFLIVDRVTSGLNPVPVFRQLGVAIRHGAQVYTAQVLGDEAELISKAVRLDSKLKELASRYEHPLKIIQKIQEATKADTEMVARQAAVLEGTGYLLGIEEEDIELGIRQMDVEDYLPEFQEISAAVLLDLIRYGGVHGRGGRAPWQRHNADLFMQGARECDAAFAENKFITSAAAAWGGGLKKSGASNVVASRSINMGREVVRELRRDALLKDAAGVPNSVYKINGHKNHLPTVLLYKGYYQGRVADLRRRGKLEEAAILEKNQGSVFSRATNRCNLDYTLEVIAAFEGEDGLVQQMAFAIKKLKAEGMTEAVEILESNKASVFYCGLASGKLGYIAEVVAAFEGEDGLVQQMADAIAKLKADGKKDAAEVLESNQRTVFSRALASGKLGYIAEVLAAFEGEDGLVQQMADAIVKLKADGKKDEAEVLESNQRTVFSRALVLTRLDYTAEVVAAFEGEDGLVQQMADAIVKLKADGKKDEAEVLENIQGTVFSMVFSLIDLGFIKKVYDYLNEFDELMEGAKSKLSEAKYVSGLAYINENKLEIMKMGIKQGSLSGYVTKLVAQIKRKIIRAKPL